MIAGDLRGAVVREFAVMGDAVNVAARFKDLDEPGHIHIGAETAAGAREQFELIALPPLVLRGKQQQGGSLPRRARRARAAGRGRERSRARSRPVSSDGATCWRRSVSAREAARAGQARMVLAHRRRGHGQSRV